MVMVVPMAILRGHALERSTVKHCPYHTVSTCVRTVFGWDHAVHLELQKCPSVTKARYFNRVFGAISYQSTPNWVRDRQASVSYDATTICRDAMSH